MYVTTLEPKTMPRKSSRANRVPLGGHRQKLNVHDQDKGYSYRWFNDAPGRIQAAEQAGYEFVTEATVGDTGDGDTDLGTRVSARVGATGNGLNSTAYLMRIRQDWYDEDQDAKEQERSKIDAALRRGSVSGEPGQDGRYVPDSGISYKP